jgi:hypothetical protein
MSKTGALFINKHHYSHFDRGNRSILPVSEIDVHLVTRHRIHGGLDGFADHPLPHVAVCDAEDLDRWRNVCAWILRHHPVGRVIAVHERAVLLAAEMRSKFSLPGTDYETALRFRDKVRMKEAVLRAGAAAVPAFSALDSPEDLHRVDWSTGRKVIKSRWGLAARDLYMGDSLDQVRGVVEALNLSGAHYEIEEFVDGQIYHCDSVVQDGEIRFVSVGKYLADPSEYSPGGIFGTVLVDDPALLRRIHTMNAAVLNALGLEDGTTHLELFRTAAWTDRQGIPRSRGHGPCSLPRPVGDAVHRPAGRQPVPREDPDPGRAGRRHPQVLAASPQAPLLDHPHHEPCSGCPHSASGQLRLKMEKAHGALRHP